MMNMQELHNQIINHEGFRLKPYRCSAGKLTIGIGRNLDDHGISETEARFLMENDLADCVKDLNVIFPNQFQKFPDGIQRVLMDMRFQLGGAGFRKFRKLIQAIRGGDLKEAIVQMKDSRWYHQVTVRAENLIKIVQEYC